MSKSLRVQEITKCFSRADKPALEKVSISLSDGDIMALVGESGSGKTTLLRIIAGLENPDSGLVEINGEIACPGELCEPGKAIHFKTPTLAFGRHRIIVQAATAANTKDPNGASYEWEIAHCNDPNRVPSQYAKVENNGALECIDCPHLKGANCKRIDAQWEHIYANPEWWTSGSREDNYYQCPLKSACIGGSYEKDENGNPDIAEIDEDEDGNADVVAYDYNQDGEWDKFKPVG